MEKQECRIVRGAHQVIMNVLSPCLDLRKEESSWLTWLPLPPS